MLILVTCLYTPAPHTHTQTHTKESFWSQTPVLPIVIAFAILGIVLQVCEPLSSSSDKWTSGGLGKAMDMPIFNKQKHRKNVDGVQRETQRATCL